MVKREKYLVEFGPRGGAHGVFALSDADALEQACDAIEAGGCDPNETEIALYKRLDLTAEEWGMMRFGLVLAAGSFCAFLAAVVALLQDVPTGRIILFSIFGGLLGAGVIRFALRLGGAFSAYG